MDAETNRAYLAGLKLKNSGLSEEIIYARLEKQGFSEELSRQVARDVFIEMEKEEMKEKVNYGLVILALGILGSVASFFIFDDRIYIFPGLIAIGIGAALLWVAKKKEP